MTEELNDYLRRIFANDLNYGGEDICAPIDPLTYKNPEGDNCLHIAAMNGETRAINYFIAAGFDVNGRGDMGHTPLHYAKTFKHAEVIKLLLENGADPDLLNEFGRKALD